MDTTELQTYIQTNTLDEAVTLLQKEHADAEQEGDKEKAALASNDLGVVYLLQNRMGDARGLFGQAQRMFIELDDAAGQGRAVGNLAQLEERAGNGDAGGALYMQAADLLHEGKAYADEYTTRRRLSRFYLKKGATLQALSESAKALAVKPNASLWDKIQLWFYRLPLKLMGVE
jgi:tetratricopeptide (TPR) repeat protein